MRRIPVAVLLTIAAFAAGATAGLADGRIPYDVAVRIGFGADPGSASLSEDVALALVGELRAKGCFRAVGMATGDGSPEGDLLLDVTLTDLLEETRYEQSIAQRAQPIDAAQSALAHVAVLSLNARVRLAALPGGTVVRDTEFHVSAERRPRTPGDDARAGVRADALLDLARKTRADVCRGSRSRLARDIEDARRAP